MDSQQKYFLQKDQEKKWDEQAPIGVGQQGIVPDEIHQG
jgi:hypothetical protein